MPLRILSPELQAKAEINVNEVPTRIQQDLQLIREWLAEQPHLTARTDDQWLLGFLRGCKHNLDKVKQKLDLFYTMRTSVPEFFADRDPFSPDIQELLTYGTCVPLPKTSADTSKTTILIRHKAVDCDKIHIMGVIRIILMTLDILLMEDDNFVICGIDAIDDLRGIPLRHLLQMTPNNIRKTMTCCQTAYPVRPQQVHFLNTFSAFESLLKVVKLFMSEKLKNRINIYSESHIGKLQDFISPDILPNEYGGRAGPVEDMIVEWKAKVESYREWFLEDAKYCADESKRPRKPNKLTEFVNTCKQYFTQNHTE